MPTVKDLQYRDADDVFPAFSTVSDPGTGAFPILRETEVGVEWQSSATTTTVVPWDDVIQLVRTKV